MRQLNNGRKYYLALALLLSLAACRQSKPPSIEVCITDGVGGADCIEKDGSKLYRPPSQFENYWATNQSDQAALISWCYEIQRDHAEMAMSEIQRQAKDREAP